MIKVIKFAGFYIQLGMRTNIKPGCIPNDMWSVANEETGQTKQIEEKWIINLVNNL